jgi:hypothetical protein
MISRYYMTESLVPHGVIYTDGLASPETADFKGLGGRGKEIVNRKQEIGIRF